MKKLNEICQLLKEKNLLVKGINVDDETLVKDITYDSREIETGSLFFCKGVAFKEEYLRQSLENGACAYVAEKDYGLDAKALIVSDIRKAMLEVAAYFFDYPDKKIKIIGVTGTKGKTTTVKFLKSIFDNYLEKNDRKPCGIISTVDTYDGIRSYESSLTTPEAIPLYKNINNAVRAGLDFLIIEVSSQALKYDRVNNVHFDIGAFLNFGDDHVSKNEHPSLDDYFYSKMKLADISKTFIYNSKMDRVEDVKKYLSERNIEGKTFSIDESKDDIYAEDIEYIKMTSEFTAVYDDTRLKCSLDFPGDYNIENALCAIYISHFMGVDDKSILHGLEDAEVEGRNTVLATKDEKLVCWVNYAHNGLSFEKSFETIKKSYPDYRIISIFGVPGDRAKSRLRDMSTIAAKNSDMVMIVPDDPGSRPFKQIAQDMIDYIKKYNQRYEVHSARVHAIEHIFETNYEKTLLFIAGKGSDKHDNVGGKIVVIEDDVSIVTRLVKSYDYRNN